MEQSLTKLSINLEPPTPRLSICISTFNRADFIRETLDTIVPQLTDQCELLVVDNASSDNTVEIVSKILPQSARLRYLRMETNHGTDRNFDRAIELCRGDYCWLASDDDLFKPGAISAVLTALDQEPSAVLVDYEFKDFSMAKVLQKRVLDFDEDRVYGPWELDRMFIELGEFVRYIGAVVIRRAVWLSRDRNLYAGSAYHFVGMLYQERLPRSVYVIAKPYISYRYGNVGAFSGQTMELVLSKWPSLVASFPISDSAKRKLHSAEPWKHPFELLIWRGVGFYTYDEYRRWLRPQLRRARERLIPLICSALPCSLTNLALTLYLSPRRDNPRQLRGFYLAVLEASPFHFRNWKRRAHKQQLSTKLSRQRTNDADIKAAGEP